MGKLRTLSGSDVCRILEKHAFAEVRRRGSHIVMQRKVFASTITVPVPDHKELLRGTFQLFDSPEYHGQSSSNAFRSNQVFQLAHVSVDSDREQTITV